MICYFSNVSGSPSVADLRCEGPLRPLGVSQAQVELMVRLVSDRDDFDVHVGERHLMAAYLEFSAESASNVTMTWSSSLPIARVTLLSWVPCEVVEETERQGKLTCGQILKRAGETPLGVEIYFNPLEAGNLEISVEFSSEEPEIEPSDNEASLQFTITQNPRLVATLSNHTSAVYSVAFSPDSTTLASGSLDGTVRLWDVETLSNTTTLKTPKGDTWTGSVAFSPDGNTLAAGMQDGKVRLWDVETGADRTTFDENIAVNHPG